MAIAQTIGKKSTLGIITPPRTAEPQHTQIDDLSAETGRSVVRSTGRPAGKRSDPAFEKVGVYLDSATRKKAERKWEDEGKGDLSDLIGKLLASYASDQ